MIDRRLFSEAKAARLVLLLTVTLGFITGVTVIIQAFLLSRIINFVFLGGNTLHDVSGYLWALGAVIVFRAVLSWGGQTTAKHLATHIKTELRTRLMTHLFALGATYTRGERSGELTNTATEGIEALDAYFSDYLPGAFNALLVPALILFVAFPVDVLTGVVFLVTAPLIPLFMALIGMIAGRLARSQYGAMSRMSAHFLDVMQGLTTLKLFNRTERQRQTIQHITDEFRKSTMSVLRVAFLSAFWLEFLATISVALVAVEIGVRLLHGGIPFEAAFFLLVLAPDYYLPLRSLGAKFHAGTEGVAASQRIFEVLDTPLPPSVEQPVPIPARHHIRFDEVQFSYDAERHALKGVSFEIKQGQRVALVGYSGGGKSTIASLLLRFIHPTGGSITVDGVDLNTLDAHHWRETLAWVPQSPYLFNDTIAANIRLGKADAPQAEVEQAAKQAGIHDFILMLPEGYETIVGERGARLSGGQAQRVAIARAFLRDAPLLILDEATSNLDPQTEAQIESALETLMQGRTVLIIAHRLSTVYRADQIIVLQDGNIAQQGSHTDLLAAGGVYQELVGAYDA